MSKFIIQIVLILFTAQLMFRGALGFHERSNCTDALSIVNKRALSLMTLCRHDIKFEDADDRVRKDACIYKCMFIKEKILTHDGILKLGYTKSYLENNVPKILFRGLKPRLEKCSHFAAALDPNDVNCRSYNDLATCVAESLDKACDDDDIKKLEDKDNV